MSRKWSNLVNQSGNGNLLVVGNQRPVAGSGKHGVGRIVDAIGIGSVHIPTQATGMNHHAAAVNQVILRTQLVTVSFGADKASGSAVLTD
nr:MAG TPA: hypothetical protein [Caudoviricetes sp.]